MVATDDRMIRPDAQRFMAQRASACTIDDFATPNGPTSAVGDCRRLDQMAISGVSTANGCDARTLAGTIGCSLGYDEARQDWLR